MPFDDLREFLSLLKEEEELSRVSKKVNGDSYDASIISGAEKVYAPAVEGILNPS